jgi:hypothetical protein
MTYEHGAWFTHTMTEERPEFHGRVCVKQKAGGWAVIREAEEIGGPAKGFCYLSHGDEPSRRVNLDEPKKGELVSDDELRAFILAQVTSNRSLTLALLEEYEIRRKEK